jgi:nucleoid-associated protein YgaU
VPSRASISLKFEEAPKPLPGTNPTSGGPPGSTVHTITEGDSLARIAHDTYGSPGTWREIAERNGIDDPLRLRNGAALFLPGG